ncbi:MAG: hypothetical protein SFU98_04845 [Leptospiraceae bacterium]|nr:hypothetical protein [Leptospiraceae bacterium]
MKKILILVLILSYVSNCEKKEEKPNPIFLLPLISNLNTLNTYPQKTINEDLAISIDSTFSNIYNSNLAGTIGGIVNRTANCPLSGILLVQFQLHPLQLITLGRFVIKRLVSRLI